MGWVEVQSLRKLKPGDRVQVMFPSDWDKPAGIVHKEAIVIEPKEGLRHSALVEMKDSKGRLQIFSPKSIQLWDGDAR